jgi:hypothetical protein
MSRDKSHMRTDGIDELLLVKYLLGRLTEEEQVQVEDRAFANRDYMHALNAAEADLIDAYVRGDLPQTDRRAFEDRFLASPQRRQKVEFAQALARVADEAAPLPAQPSEPPNSWLAFLNPMRSWNSALRFAGAMGAVICVAGTTWLAVENASMRSRLSAVEAVRRDLEGRAQSLRQELSQAQARADHLAALQKDNTASTSSRSPLIASLILIAGPTRAESRTEQIVLGRETQIAHIEIQLEPRDDYPRFRADVQTRSGKEVLSFGGLMRRSAGEVQSVSMDIPSGVLSSGEYEIALKGLHAGKAAQDIGYYYFRVQKE